MRGREVLVGLVLFGLGTFAFGLFAGLVVGISAETTAGRDVLIAMLGGGLVTQVLTAVGGSSPELVGVGLLGFGLGGSGGLLLGLKKRKTWQRIMRGSKPSSTKAGV